MIVAHPLQQFLWDHRRMSTPAERPRAKSLNPLLALRPFLRPYRFMMVGALFALLIAAAAQLALPVAFRHLIDQAFAERNLPLINTWLTGFLAATVIFG